MQETKIGLISALENVQKTAGPGPDFLTEEATAAARHIHCQLPGYAPTPLVRLDALARRLGLRAFFVKDESKRFGLNAFKGLGGLYALTRVICRQLGLETSRVSFSDLKKPEYSEAVSQMVFVTATDGNHGRGISWAAGQLGCEAHVYMPAGSSPLRAQAIRDVNPRAKVEIMAVGYDDAVRHAAKVAAERGWFLVQDTSWDGYVDIPTWIIHGYTTMAWEACAQLREQGLAPTHFFVQAGVGAMAGGMVGYLVNAYGPGLKIGVVEPESIPCIYASAKAGDGAPHGVAVPGPTMMAGLNCGEPCTLTWPILRDHADWYFACPDSVSAYGMRLLAAPTGGDPAIISGESGAVTTGLAALIAGDPEYRALRERMALNESSVVLCISTEGDTDPVRYRQVVYEGSESLLRP